MQALSQLYPVRNSSDMLYMARDFITSEEAVALLSSYTTEICFQVSSDARPRRDCWETPVRTDWMRHSGTGLLHRNGATCLILRWPLLQWKFDFELLFVFTVLMS